MDVVQTGEIILLSENDWFSVRITWTEKIDKSTNKSFIAISNFEAMSPEWYGYSYFLDGSILINGVAAIRFVRSDEQYYVSWDSLNTFEPIGVRKGGTPPPWNAVEVEHNPDGDKTISIEIDITGRAFSWDGTPIQHKSSPWAVKGEISIDLTHIDWGVVPIDGELHQVFVDNGSGWDQLLTHIDDGSDFELCSG